MSKKVLFELEEVRLDDEICACGRHHSPVGIWPDSAVPPLDLDGRPVGAKNARQRGVRKKRR